MAITLTIDSYKQLMVSREVHTKAVTVKQDALANADYPSGLLLALDSDSGKMVAATSGADAVCALINPIAKAAIVAGDVKAEVVYLSKVGKPKIIEANADLQITEKFMGDARENKLDIKGMIPDLVVQIESLEITGDWTNTQYTEQPVDKTGLTFTVKYTDGDTKTVNASAAEPWGDEAGEQTAVFSYTEGGVTVTAEKEATVVLDVPASLAVSGDWTNEQKVSTTVDPTGLTFTATYLSGKTADVTANVTVSPASWGETAGEQTATFSYTEGEVTVTVDKAATVAE